MSAEYEDYRFNVLRLDESAFITLGILGAVLFILLYVYWCAGECAKQNIRRLGVIILVRKRTEGSESLCPGGEAPPVTDPPPYTTLETQQDTAPNTQLHHSPATTS